MCLSSASFNSGSLKKLCPRGDNLVPLEESDMDVIICSLDFIENRDLGTFGSGDGFIFPSFLWEVVGIS